MKIYPIVSFKSTSFKQNIKEKEISSQDNRSERNSLEILGNYNKGGILAFKGESAEEIKEECKALLAQSGRKKGEILTISHNPFIAQIQKDILEHILKNDKFPNTPCDLVVNTIRDDEEIAKIQKEILGCVLDNDRFGEDETRVINFSIKNDIEVAKIQRDLFFDLLNNKKFDNYNLVNCVSMISKNRDNAQNQYEVIK